MMKRITCPDCAGTGLAAPEKDQSAEIATCELCEGHGWVKVVPMGCTLRDSLDIDKIAEINRELESYHRNQLVLGQLCECMDNDGVLHRGLEFQLRVLSRGYPTNWDAPMFPAILAIHMQQDIKMRRQFKQKYNLEAKIPSDLKCYKITAIYSRMEELAKLLGKPFDEPLN